LGWRLLKEGLEGPFFIAFFNTSECCVNEFSALILQGDATAIAGLVVILAGLYLVVRLSGMLLKGALIVGVIVLIAVWIFPGAFEVVNANG
jgi:hypothetical protein